jgi:hypothetical protein
MRTTFTAAAAAFMALVVLPNAHAANECLCLTSIERSAVALAGLRSARLSPSGPDELILYGNAGVFRTHLLAGGTLAPPERISNAIEAWPLDANGDRRDDLVLRFGGDSLGVALTSPHGEVGPVSVWLAGRYLAAGDLDGDHMSEIAFRRADGSVALAWSDRHQPYSRVTSTRLAFPGNRGSAACIGDMIAKGAGELVLVTPGGPEDTVRVFKCSRNGEPTQLMWSPIPRAVPHDAVVREAVVGDVDGVKGGELLLLRASSPSPGLLQIVRVNDGYLVADATLYGLEGEPAVANPCRSGRRWRSRRRYRHEPRRVELDRPDSLE